MGKRNTAHGKTLGEPPKTTAHANAYRPGMAGGAAGAGAPGAGAGAGAAPGSSAGAWGIAGINPSAPPVAAGLVSNEMSLAFIFSFSGLKWLRVGRYISV